MATLSSFGRGPAITGEFISVTFGTTTATRSREAFDLKAGKKYFYKRGSIEVHIGDLVVVPVGVEGGKFAVAKVVEHDPHAKRDDFDISKVRSFIIQAVDMNQYEFEVAQAERKLSLLARLREESKKEDELSKYRRMAEGNPEISHLLKELETLGGL